jgi:hypothetical protein
MFGWVRIFDFRDVLGSGTFWDEADFPIPTISATPEFPISKLTAEGSVSLGVGNSGVDFGDQLRRDHIGTIIPAQLQHSLVVVLFILSIILYKS